MNPYLMGRKAREILSSRMSVLVDRKQTISVLEMECVSRRPMIKLIRIEQAAMIKNFGGKNKSLRGQIRSRPGKTQRRVRVIFA